MACSVTQSVCPFQICQCLIKRREVIPDYQEERDKITMQCTVSKYKGLMDMDNRVVIAGRRGA